MIEIRIAEEMLHLLSIKYDDGSMTGVALIFWSSFMIVAHRDGHEARRGEARRVGARRVKPIPSSPRLEARRGELDSSK